MKTKFYILLILALFLSTSCKDNSQSPTNSEPVTTEKQNASNQDSDSKNSNSQSIAAEKQESESDETEYFALFMDGNKIGHAIETRKVVNDQVETAMLLNLSLSRMGITIGIETTSKTFETLDGQPLGYEIEQNLGVGSSKTTGKMNENGKLVITSGQQTQELDWQQGAVMSEGMRLIHEKNGLEEGNSYIAKMFDPSTNAFFDVEVNIGSKEQVDLLGRVVELTKITSVASSMQTGKLETVEYYDNEMKLQKSITPVMGFTLEQIACSKEFALGDNDVFEVVDKMFLPSPKALNNLNSIKSVTYNISKKTDNADLVFPSNDNQKVQKLNNGNVIITVTPLKAPKGINFPYKGNDPDALEALKPTRYVENDQQIIIDLAKKAIGNTTDAAEAAYKIEEFVGNYIDNKNLSIGYASAAEVAKSKQGDCSEHAVLTAALCKAIGIPAQVVTGFAYVSQWQSLSNGFGGHAWTQVYIGDKWINIDAAFKGTNRDGYDAGHIALSIGNGNPEAFLSLVNTMGQFNIDKIEIE